MNSYARCGCALVAIELYLSLLFVFDWGSGVERGLLIVGLLGALFLLRAPFWTSLPRPTPAKPSPRTRNIVIACLCVVISVEAAVAGEAILRSYRTREIPLDQGQTTWRSARLVLKGENPYGFGAVVDFYGYTTRTDQRRAQGMDTELPSSEIERTLESYDESLSPDLREQLLPTGNIDRWHLGEARFLGYKYGPIPIDMTALFARLDQPFVVVLLNILMCFVLFVAMYRILCGITGQPIPAAMGLVAIMSDSHINWNYIELTATDVWALAFCAMAVLSFRAGRPLVTAALLALALGCKIFPSLIFVPLLFETRALRPWGVFIGITALVYGPWLLWDPLGVPSNVFLWPFVMAKDTTSWLVFAPEWISAPVRLAALSAIVFLWFRYLSGREKSLVWVLAVANTVLLGVGGVFHNNYVPWASIWVVAAVIERFFSDTEGLVINKNKRTLINVCAMFRTQRARFIRLINKIFVARDFGRGYRQRVEIGTP